MDQIVGLQLAGNHKQQLLHHRQLLCPAGAAGGDGTRRLLAVRHEQADAAEGRGIVSYTCIFDHFIVLEK